MDWTMAIGPALGLVGGVLVVVIDRLWQRHKLRAETGKTLAEADLTRLRIEIGKSDFWKKLCHDVQSEYARLSEKHDELSRQVDGLARELNTMKHIIAKLWAGLTILLRQLDDNRIRPAWEPDIDMVRYCTALLEDDDNA